MSKWAFRAFVDELRKLGGVPLPVQSEKIPKRPKNAPWEYDPRPVEWF